MKYEIEVRVKCHVTRWRQVEPQAKAPQNFEEKRLNKEYDKPYTMSGKRGKARGSIRTQDIGRYFFRKPKIPGKEMQNTELGSMAENDEVSRGRGRKQQQQRKDGDTQAQADQRNSSPEIAKDDKTETDGSEQTVHAADTATDPKVDDRSSEILAAIKALDSKLDSKTGDITGQINAVSKELDKKFSEVSTKLKDMEDSLNYAHKDIGDLKEAKARLEKETKRLKERLDNTQKDTKALQKDLKETKELIGASLNETERRSRNYSIRVHNVADLPKRAAPEKYIALLSDLLVQHKLVPSEDKSEVAQHIEIAHPIGREGNQLIARFYGRPYRNNVLRLAKKNLPRGEEEIRFQEDMTKADYLRRKSALPHMQRAFDEGKKVAFRNGQLIIDGLVVPFVPAD